MSHTRAWNDAYEALPTDDNYGYEIDDYIRQDRVDVRERLEVDHEMKVSTTHDGKHKKVTFRKQTANPATVTKEGFLFTKDVSNKIELFWKDEDGNVVQLTSVGELLPFPSGTKMYFYQNVAPSGWTIDATCADALLAVKGGSQAYNVDGGNQAGTWTQPDHTLTTAELPNLTYKNTKTLGGSITAFNNIGDTAATINWKTGIDQNGGGAHNHGDSGRPLAQVGIIATKD